VFVSSPVSFTGHASKDNSLSVWAGIYAAHTPPVFAATNATMRLQGESEPQPDVMLRLDETHGGQSRIEDNFLYGAPEFVGEVSSTTTHYDLHDKYDLYEEVGVCEYLVWRVWDEAIDWFVLGDDRKYRRLDPKGDGIYQSRKLPGLWLDATAMVRGDMKRVLELLQRGIDSEAHRTFLKQPGDPPKA